jgi:hypothetical protein
MTVYTRRDLVLVTTSTTGTGTITVGAAVTGFKAFVAGDDGKTFRYSIRDGANSETGYGVYTHSGATLTRNVIESTNSNSAISLSGSAEVAIAPLADDITDAFKREWGIACSDEATALTTGTAKATFHAPRQMTLAEVIAELSTAQASGSIFTVDINKNGSTILSTKLTIDNTEKTSITAATAPVISDTAIAKGDEITVDIDQIGTSGAKGLKVWLLGQVHP